MSYQKKNLIIIITIFYLFLTEQRQSYNPLIILSIILLLKVSKWSFFRCNVFVNDWRIILLY